MIRLCYAYDQLIHSNYDCLALLAILSREIIQEGKHCVVFTQLFPIVIFQMCELFMENYQRYQNKEPLLHVVDPDKEY